MHEEPRTIKFVALILLLASRASHLAADLCGLTYKIELGDLNCQYAFERSTRHEPARLFLKAVEQVQQGAKKACAKFGGPCVLGHVRLHELESYLQNTDPCPCKIPRGLIYCASYDLCSSLSMHTKFWHMPSSQPLCPVGQGVVLRSGISQSVGPPVKLD